MKILLGLATIASTFLVLFTPQSGRTQTILPQPVSERSTAQIDRQQQTFVPPVPARVVVPIDREQAVFIPTLPIISYPVTPIYPTNLSQNSGAIDNPITTTIVDPFAPIAPNRGGVPSAIDIRDYNHGYPHSPYVQPTPSPVMSPDRQLVDPRGARYACTNSIIGIPSATPSAINRYTGQPCR